MIKIFNDTLTNDIVSFEQLGPDCFSVHLVPPEKGSILTKSSLPLGCCFEQCSVNSVDPDLLL